MTRLTQYSLPRALNPLDIQFERVAVLDQSASGTPYIRWIPCGMPKIGQYADLLKTVFFLYETEEDALAGTDSGGTGFLVAIPSKRWGSRVVHVHAVTNWHVAVFNEDGPPLPVLRVNRKAGGKPITFSFDPAEWIFQPASYDVAVSPPLNFEGLEDHDAK